MSIRLTITSIFSLSILMTKAQDSLQQVPSDYLKNITVKTNQVENMLDKKSARVLYQIMNVEAKMKNKLLKVDSLKGKEIFNNIERKYKELLQRREDKTRGRQYIPALDTLKTSLTFLQQNPGWISPVRGREGKLKDAIEKVDALQDQFQKAEEIKRFLKERQQFLKDQLGQLGFVRQLRKLNKRVYYYSEQLKEYKETLKDHKKAERKALGLLSKTKLFQDFMRKNSMLASLFRFPGDPDDPVSQVNLAGLQTRTQVNILIQQQIRSVQSNDLSQLWQNMESARSQVNRLKNRISGSGGSSDDMIPEGFKPNGQRTKRFWKRFGLVTNTQSQKATRFFPVTSDLGLSLGYKLNDKSIIGIGASYKLGWGYGWHHIKFTGEGAGLRSFIDWKIPSPLGGAGGGLWISGGYELNYKASFNDFSQLKNYNEWQQSGLIGLSKVISLKTRFLKSTKLQLLWDFLSYKQIPRTQSILYRVGYTLK
jgi:hypothetical protein